MFTQSARTTKAFALVACLLTTTSLASVEYPAPPAVTAAPPLHLIQRQLSGLGACSALSSSSASCSFESSGFLSLDFTDQAYCLCYSSSTFDPEAFDTAVDGCLSYLETASPSLYESISGDLVPTAPCEELIGGATVTLPGDDDSTTITTTTPLTSRTTSRRTSISSLTAAPSGLPRGCTTWFNIYSSCTSETSDFADLPFTEQASCLCYDNPSSYDPTRHDNAISTCYTFLEEGGLVTGAGNTAPCAAVGPVRGNSGPTTTTPGSTAGPVTITVTSPTTNGAVAAMKTGGVMEAGRAVALVGIVQVVRVLV